MAETKAGKWAMASVPIASSSISFRNSASVNLFGGLVLEGNLLNADLRQGLCGQGEESV